MFITRKQPGKQKLDDFMYAEQLSELVGRMDELGSSTLLTGSVQLVGLANIKAKLGSAWADISSQAFTIAEEEINKRLGETDIYKPEGDGYLICFDLLDETAADSLAREISGAIEERLIVQLTGIEGRDLSVTSFVAPVATAVFRTAVDMKQALKAALEEIQIQVESAAQERPIDRTLRQASVHFQPIWSRLEHGKTHNRAVIDPLTGAGLAALIEEFDDRDDWLEALHNLDCVLFTKAVEGLHSALGETKRVSVLIPLHYSTLSGDLSDELIALGKAVPRSYQKFVVLDVIGVPASAGLPELLRAAKVANQLAERVIFQIDPAHPRVDESFLELLWGVSYNLQDQSTEDAGVQREMARFALIAAQTGLQSFSYGANTLGKAIAAVRAQFDYVGGAAVHNTVPVPRPQSRFSPVFGEISPKKHVRTPLRGTAVRGEVPFTPANPSSVLTLPDRSRQPCRVLEVSVLGAVVHTTIRPPVGAVLGLGSVPARVTNVFNNRVTLEFLTPQHFDQLEPALIAPFRDQKVLRVA